MIWQKEAHPVQIISQPYGIFIAKGISVLRVKERDLPVIGMGILASTVVSDVVNYFIQNNPLNQ